VFVRRAHVGTDSGRLEALLVHEGEGETSKLGREIVLDLPPHGGYEWAHFFGVAVGLFMVLGSNQYVAESR
jgi:hypothetical protein